MEHLSFDARNFSGRVRLFPLPNLVMFPHVMQPLHVFEPRYRDLLADALADDALIAMALLAPGWEKEYDDRPIVHPVACLGRIATHRQLDDGRYNLLLLGQRRVRLVEELPPQRTFREARVELIDDEFPADSAEERRQLRQVLMECFERIVPDCAEIREPIEQCLTADVSLGMLTDIISYTLDLSLETKMQLLVEANVDRRARLLAQHLEAISRAQSSPGKPATTYPPDFSAN